MSHWGREHLWTLAVGPGHAENEVLGVHGSPTARGGAALAS
jgi:hypothetical protein